jgi:hypothetical protein
MARMRKGSAIRAVAVADQVAWKLVPAAGPGQLTGKPFPHWDGLSQPATEARGVTAAK